MHLEAHSCNVAVATGRIIPKRKAPQLVNEQLLSGELLILVIVQVAKVRGTKVSKVRRSEGARMRRCEGAKVRGDRRAKIDTQRREGSIRIQYSRHNSVIEWKVTKVGRRQKEEEGNEEDGEGIPRGIVRDPPGGEEKGIRWDWIDVKPQRTWREGNGGEGRGGGRESLREGHHRPPRPQRGASSASP